MLTGVGMGPAGLHLMTPAAREAVADADVLVGGKRHLLQFPAFAGEQFVLGANIAELLNWIAGQQDKRIVVLASGDPLFYGIGTRMVAHFGIERVRIIPGISAVQYLCAQSGIDMNDMWLTSSHGRSVCFDELARHRKVAMVTDARCVWFVGAGPGDRELITLKGYRLLQQAQVVIYAGSLINTELLDYCPPGAECHDSAELHLEQILDLMEAGVKAGKTVVRLQTGDVSLYGSVREQGEELTRRGIDWQVVPGVSAFLGAAAELGVEYTVPEVSQSLIITRLEGRTPVPEREQLESFASHQTSMAIYLSVQRIHRVAERLIEGGYPTTTPVAVIYKATWPESQTVRGTLADIGDKVREAGIRKTALILVGNFLGDEYHYSKLYAADFSHEYRKA